MNLQFNIKLVENYKSNSQKARVLSEDWVFHNSYCPNCGNNDLEMYQRNNPAADFYCENCNSDYELKSFKNLPKNKIVDGAYASMIKKIRESENPNFFFLQYDSKFSVTNYFTVPKHFITFNIIEKRKPLAESARRAHWTGCNILFGNLPQSGIIHLVKDSSIVNPKDVLWKWKRTSFLAQKKIETRGWLIEIIRIVDRIPSNSFTIQDVYAFKELLMQKYPNNKFIKEKIRQELQVLRNRGLIKFTGKGNYLKVE